jgi:hypothetical protein
MNNQLFVPTGNNLTTDQLKFGYWFVAHKLLLRRIAILFLLLADFCLILYAAYFFFDYYILSANSETAVVNQLAAAKLNGAALESATAVKPIDILWTKVFAGGDNKYDFVASVTNPNPNWLAASVSYHFQNGDTATPGKTDFILPGEEKYLFDLGRKVEQNLATADLIIDAISWEKVADFATKKDTMLAFTVADEKIERLSADAVRGSFSIINNSAYNFSSVNLKILLYGGSSLVAVNQLPLALFSSGAKENLDFILPGVSSSANKITVIPEINIYNPDSFKKFEGSGQPK